MPEALHPKVVVEKASESQTPRLKRSHTSTTSEPNQKKSILDEQKQIINQLRRSLESKQNESDTKQKKILELQQRIKSDEQLMKKTLSESAKLKRQQETIQLRKPAIRDFQPPEKKPIPDIDNLKSNFMNHLTS